MTEKRGRPRVVTNCTGIPVSLLARKTPYFPKKSLFYLSLSVSISVSLCVPVSLSLSASISLSPPPFPFPLPQQYLELVT